MVYYYYVLFDKWELLHRFICLINKIMILAWWRILCSYDLNCCRARVCVRYVKRDPHAASVAELKYITVGDFILLISYNIYYDNRKCSNYFVLRYMVMNFEIYLHFIIFAI